MDFQARWPWAWPRAICSWVQGPWCVEEPWRREMPQEKDGKIIEETWETYGKSPYELRFIAGKRSSLKLNGDQWGIFQNFPCLITEGYNSSCGRCDLAVTTPWSFFLTQSGRWHCSLCLCGMSLSLWPGFCCLNCECAMQMWNRLESTSPYEAL